MARQKPIVTSLLQSSFWLLLASLALCGCANWHPVTVKALHDVEYAGVNGQSLRLDLYEPKTIPDQVPVLVWIHGGAWNRGSKDFCPIAFMAAQRLAIVSIDYRLAPGATFPAQLCDCKGAIRWLRAHASQYQLDPDRIGVFGASAGGHLALLLAATADDPWLEGDVGGNLAYSSRVQCVCAFYPPTDLNRLVTNPADRKDPHSDVGKLLGGPVADNVAKANVASPLFYVNKTCAPVFLMHGGNDTLVPPEQSRLMYRALKQSGVEAQLEIIPNQGHGIIAPPPVADEIYRFFARHLGDARAANEALD